MAAVLRGAPVTTRDLDVVHARTSANVERLGRVLAAFDARIRGDPRGIHPPERHLASAGDKLLLTRIGPGDVLGSIEDGTTCDDLMPPPVSSRSPGSRSSSSGSTAPSR